MQRLQELSNRALEKVLQENRLKFTQVIHSNLRKQQYVFLVHDDRQSYMLKFHCEPDSGFHTEKRVYGTRESQYLVKCHKIGRNFILLDNFEGITLRHALRRRSDVSKVVPLKALFDSSRFFKDPCFRATPAEIRKALQGGLTRLLTSGPADVRELPLCHRKLARIISRVSKSLSGPLFSFTSRRLSLTATNQIHGDAHLNNVLVNESGQIKWIDWENARAGSLSTDWLYFWAQVIALTSRSRLQSICEAEYARYDLRNAGIFSVLLPLYISAAKSNHRFGGKKGILGMFNLFLVPLQVLKTSFCCFCKRIQESLVFESRRL